MNKDKLLCVEILEPAEDNTMLIEPRGHFFEVF